MIFAPDTPRRMRRMNLTPMIDVVFLLVVFFLLAARFGVETALDIATVPAPPPMVAPVTVPMPGAAGVGAWPGPPRLVAVGPEATMLNGIALSDADLPAALGVLMSDPADPIVLRGVGGAPVQRMLDVIARLEAAGLRRLLLVE